jgi:tRNA 2-thiocytidine biosynthesis protein TtcA
MTRLLAEMDVKFPGTRQNMLAALGNVRPSHLFDKGLWKKLGLEVAVEHEGSGSFAADPGDMIPVERLLRGMA